MILGEEGRLAQFVHPDALFVSTTEAGHIFSTVFGGLKECGYYEELKNVIGCGAISDRFFFGNSSGEILHAFLTDLGPLHDFRTLRERSAKISVFDVSSYGRFLSAAGRSIEISDINNTVLATQDFPFIVRSGKFFDDLQCVGMIGNFFQMFDLRTNQLSATAAVAYPTCFARHRNFQVAIGSADGAVQLFDLRSPDSPLLATKAHENCVSTICSTGEGLLSGSVDGSLSLTNFARPEKIANRLLPCQEKAAVRSLTSAEGRYAYLTDLGSIYFGSI